jgi:hypothetical protein
MEVVCQEIPQYPNLVSIQARELRILYLASKFDQELNSARSVLCNESHYISSTLSPYAEQKTGALKTYWRTSPAGITEIDGAPTTADWYDEFRTWSESFRVLAFKYHVVDRYETSSRILVQA